MYRKNIRARGIATGLAVMATATYCTNTILDSAIITPIRRNLLISWDLFFGLFCHIPSISNSYPQVYPQNNLTDYIFRHSRSGVKWRIVEYRALL
jgi:hypothetical protein